MSEFTLERLEAEGSEDGIDTVERAFQYLVRAKPAEAWDLLSDWCETILAYLGRPGGHNPVTSVFAGALSRRERRFVATCLLRLLAGNDWYFQQHPDFRVAAVKLFDDLLGKELYPVLKITTGQQTFEKVRALKDAAPEAESKVRDVIDSLSSLDRLEDFRQRLMRMVKEPLVSAVVLPFLPRSLLHESRLREVFDAIRSYRQASGSSVRKAFERALGVVEQYLKEAQACKTIYCQYYLVEMGEKLQGLLKEDFLNSDVGQPAEVTVKPLDKKYAFHVEDRELKLGFQIQNLGPGYAFDVQLEATDSSENIALYRSISYLGQLEPGSVLIADLPARVTRSEEVALVEVTVKWINADSSDGRYTCLFELHGQRSDIDWEALEREDPYSLEPVESHLDLVGRSEVLNQLVRQSRAKSVGSCYIFGQKRVGKTSIAKALKSRLEEESAIRLIYLEGGEYVHPDPEATLGRLGTRLCEKIKKSDKRLANLDIPEFKGALSPLTDFLDSARELVPDLRILFILDEFDELPIELYKRGPLADAFFLTIRAVSGKPPYGFILVGGEKMEFVMSCQGDTLNKFQGIQVDYFDRDEHQSDFRDLVTRPTRRWLEISDEAIVTLQEKTAGHPYYTMVICRELLAMVLRKRDCHVTKREVDQAVQLALQKIRANGFQHFWEDGIFEAAGDKVEEVSVNRRRILIGLASILRRQEKASKEDIATQDVVCVDPEALDSELRRFVQRGILVEEDGLYDCKIPFFRAWLERNGVRDILTTFSDLDAILQRKRQEEQAYVQPEEIVNLISGWGPYQGKRITEDEVRGWLRQFGSPIQQRLMFKILQNLRFYSDDLLRSKMKEAHGIVRRGLVREYKPGQRKRGDILVSYLDSPGKSGGGRYAKLYADENGIYYNNVVERSKLARVVSERKNDLQALVFIDDLVGTGRSAQDYFRKLSQGSGQVLREAGLRIYFIAVTGFVETQQSIESTLTECDLPVEVHICGPLDSSAKCFGEHSRIFPEVTERSQAETIAYGYGARLVRKNPLGYGNCQLAIVFSDSCPNNSLPILWAESDNPLWKPLFKRPMPEKQF